ncbi:hypothetical protein C0V77_20920 [Emticicia sp. TH156]|nr:hypothetical protein C0V77_20920 [Emticicia sp. TH156]
MWIFKRFSKCFVYLKGLAKVASMQTLVAFAKFMARLTFAEPSGNHCHLLHITDIKIQCSIYHFWANFLRST